MKILIVEDEAQIAKGIECILKEQHYFPCLTRIVSNGIEAINISKQFNPALVITDIRMQMMNGLDMIKEMNAMNLRNQFIIISGYNRFEYAQTALRYQVLDYLLKPVDKDRLLELARQVYNSLPENYSRSEERTLPDIEALQFPFNMEFYPATLQKVIQYMQKNYMCNISLQTISDKFMLHVSYLSTLINNNTGYNFNFLLNNIRLRKACELLLYESDLSVDEISYLVGFNCSRRLYNCFRQQLDTTPRDFQAKWMYPEEM
jgi:two-component system response regulator YesN